MIYTYRSRLNQLPLDLKCELGELTFQKGMLPPSRKSKTTKEIKKNVVKMAQKRTIGGYSAKR